MTRRNEVERQIRLFPVGEYEGDHGGQDEIDPLSGLDPDEDPWESIMKLLGRAMFRTGFRFRNVSDVDGNEGN